MKISKALADYCESIGVRFALNEDTRIGIVISKRLINFNSTQLAEFEAKYDNAIDTIVLHELGHLADSGNFLSTEFYLEWSGMDNHRVLQCEIQATNIGIELGKTLGIAVNEDLLIDALETYK